MKLIRFGYVYTKLPANPDPSTLLEVFVVHRDELCSGFVEYDTRIKDGGNYDLPAGKLLVLLLKTRDDSVWTTIRRYAKDKCRYYKNSRGEEFNIVMTETNKSLDAFVGRKT